MNENMVANKIDEKFKYGSDSAVVIQFAPLVKIIDVSQVSVANMDEFLQWVFDNGGDGHVDSEGIHVSSPDGNGGVEDISLQNGDLLGFSNNRFFKVDANELLNGYDEV